MKEWQNDKICPDAWWVFIYFKAENDLSALALVIGKIIANSSRWMIMKKHFPQRSLSQELIAPKLI